MNKFESYFKKVVKIIKDRIGGMSPGELIKRWSDTAVTKVIQLELRPTVFCV